MRTRELAWRAAFAGLMGSLALIGSLALTGCAPASTPSTQATQAPPAPSSLASEPSASAVETPASSPTTSSEPTPSPTSTCATITPVTLQLPGPLAAEFAGYIAARDLGMYSAECLDVSIVDGESTIDPAVAVGQGSADFGVTWVLPALHAREEGAAVTEIAQIFQRSGSLEVSRASEGIASAADFKGKLVGTLQANREYEVLAAITNAGMDPAKDVSVIPQPSDPLALLNGSLDAIQVTTYDGYPQLLIAIDPATDKRIDPAELTVVDYNTEGVAVLQDSLWASTQRLSDPTYQDVTQRFVNASLRGWIHCRDSAPECTTIVAAAQSQEPSALLSWQLNEVNKLIWPSPAGVGMIDAAAWDRTATIALFTKNLQGQAAVTRTPDESAYTNAYAQAANTQLASDGLDTTGTSFTPASVVLADASD